MSTPDQKSSNLIHAIEAILLSPETGRAVARALMANGAERKARAMVADLQARRARHAHDADMALTDGAGHDCNRHPAKEAALPLMRSG